MPPLQLAQNMGTEAHTAQPYDDCVCSLYNYLEHHVMTKPWTGMCVREAYL